MTLIFWNVDTQYDFMRKNGALYVQGAEKIERNLRKLTNLAKDLSIKVINTADWHTEESEELSGKPDFIKTFPKHCMQNTLGAQYIPATAPENPFIMNWMQAAYDPAMVLHNRNLVLYKDKFDVFSGTPHANKVVELLQPKKAIVYGVATNVCVNDAVLGLLERKVQVYVPTDAIKELPNLPLPYQTWKDKGAILTTTRDVQKMLEVRA